MFSFGFLGIDNISQLITTGKKIVDSMKVIQFDGGAVPNPSTRAIGIILIENNIVLKEISRKLEGIILENGIN